MHMTRDFGYACSDKRHYSINATPKATAPLLRQQTSHSLALNKHLFHATSDPSLQAQQAPENHHIKIFPKLLQILAKTAALDDGLNFTIHAVKATRNVVGNDSWELTLDGGNSFPLYRISRMTALATSPSSSPTTTTSISGERWGSIDALNQQQSCQDTSPSTTMQLHIYLDPEPNVFASHWREFVEYQKVYGQDWCTVCQLEIIRGLDRNDIACKIRSLGLVPTSAVALINASE